VSGHKQDKKKDIKVSEGPGYGNSARKIPRYSGITEYSKGIQTSRYHYQGIKASRHLMARYYDQGMKVSRYQGIKVSRSWSLSQNIYY
jgi:hypothetical protein